MININIHTYNYNTFLMPEWENNTKAIEQYFLNKFSSSFLRHPLLKSTMFAHLPKTATSLQKDLIVKYFGKEKTKKYLLEDSLGSPILNDFKFKTSGNSIHHLYHLAKFGSKLEINVEKINSYVELGGGYGNMSRLVKRINRSATYTIIDIPIFIYIQYVYLSTILGNEQVVIFDGKQGIIPNKINLIPLDENLIQQFSNLNYKPEVFLSTWALSESNQSTQSYIKDKDYFNAEYLLLAYQKANSSFTFSQEISNINNTYYIKYNELTEYLPDNFYLFAQRK